MRGSEPGMDTTVNFGKGFDDFMAEGQQFFVRGQGHGMALRSTVPPGTAPPRERYT